MLKKYKIKDQMLICHGREIEDKDRLIDQGIIRDSTVLDISTFVLMIYLFRLN
jgi:hypothetical protein